MMIDERSPQLPKKRLFTGVQCSHVVRTWFVHVVDEAAFRSNKNGQLLICRRVHLNVIRVGDARTF